MSALISDEWKDNCEHWEQSAVDPDPNLLKEMLKRVEKKLGYENMMKEFEKLEREKKNSYA